jgi:hypothetical protein
MKSYFSKSAHVDREDNSIFTDIEKTRYALETAYAGFENATDPDLIDCYIYEVNAVQKRYKYLLQEAAKMQHSSETPKETPLCEKPSVPLVRQAFREFPFSIG